MTTHRCFTLALLLAGAVAPRALGATSGSNGSHDPSRMLESEGRVYIYSTGGGAKSSSDGLVWSNETAPPWDRSQPANNDGVWAPDGVYVNGQFFLFAAMWTDATKASAISVISSPTLNPRSASTKWTDRGIVVSGPAGVTHSCIDPAPFLDASGNLWVVWGGGYPFSTSANSIFVTALDKTTGLAITTDPGYKPPDSPGYAIEQGHKEGPYIHTHAGYYYLFYQTGSCCSGASSTYTIHVARAQSVTGPYAGDRTFYASTGGIHGPGHIGIYDACGYSRFTYHYYPDSGSSVIGENELLWGGDGWPAVGAESTTPLVLCGSNAGPGTGGSSGTGGRGGAGGRGSATGGGGTNGDAGTTGGGGTGANGSAGTAGTATGSAGAAGVAGAAGSGAGGTGGANGAGSGAAAGSSAGVSGAAGTSGTAGSGTGSEPAATGCACGLASGRDPSGASGLEALAVLSMIAARRRRGRQRAA